MILSDLMLAADEIAQRAKKPLHSVTVMNIPANHSVWPQVLLHAAVGAYTDHGTRAQRTLLEEVGATDIRHLNDVRLTGMVGSVSVQVIA